MAGAKQVTQQYLIGRAFNNLLTVAGRLNCKQTFLAIDGRALTSIYVPATIVSDALVRCETDATFKAAITKYSLGLSVGLKDITLTTKQSKRDLLTIYSAQSVFIKYSEPSVISITSSSTADASFGLYVSKSTILGEKDDSLALVDYTCRYWHDEIVIATSEVTLIDQETHDSLALIKCLTPSIDSLKHEQGIVKVDLAITRTPLVPGIPAQTIKITSNFLTLNFMRVPMLTNVSPARIFNLASVKNVKVTGRDFFNSERLHCIIAGMHTVKALFVTENILTCPLNGVWGLGTLTTISVQVSNDGGNSLSNALPLQVVVDLP